MRNIQMLFLLLFLNNVHAQSIIKNINTEQVNADFNKIIFEYSYRSEYGSMKRIFATKECIELKKTSKNYLKFNKLYTVTEEYDGKKIIIKKIKNKNKTTVAEKDIYLLFNEITTNKDNYNYEYIRPKLTDIDESLVKLIISEYQKYYWKIENKVVTKYEEIELANQIIKFDRFKDFINKEKPKSDVIYGRMDSSLFFNITFIINKKSFVYDIIDHLKCGQPIYTISGTNEKVTIVNLDVNNYIEKILPENSLIRNEFNLQNIKEKYIRWYCNEYNNINQN